MRWLLAPLLLLLLALPAAAEDDKQREEPKEPGKKMTEAEREAALKRAEDLNERVFELWKTGKYEEAEVLAREALALREQLLGPEHPLVAHSLLNLGEGAWSRSS